MMINKIDQAIEENEEAIAKDGRFKGLEEKLKKVGKEKSSTELGYLGLINGTYNQYAGTVDPEIVRRRRAKSKRAKKNRRINRARAK